MSGTTTILDLIRHGEPEGGPMYRGGRDDSLSATGFEQMRLALDGGEAFDCVLSSPLRRCRDFAEELARAAGLALEIEPGLCEISFGDWEGRTPEQVAETDAELQSAFWVRPDLHAPPNGETLDAFFERVARSWRDCSERLRGQRVLFVGHGGVIRMILARELGMAPAVAMARIQVPYACRSRLRLDHTEHGRLASLVFHGPCS